MIMRRWATWLIVGALVALGSVAVADALRGTSESRKRVPLRTSAAPGVGQQPASDEMSGVRYYSDKEHECRVEGLRLPDLVDEPAPNFRSCRFSLSPEGAALPGDVVWSPNGRFAARERDDVIELFSTLSPGPTRIPGHAPAFKPNGTFTYVKGNDIVECPRNEVAPPCITIVARFRDWPVLELAWLSNDRMAVITQPSEYVLTIREGRLHTSTSGFGRPLTDLRVSPRGNFVAVRAEGRGGLLVLGPDGLAASLPLLTNPRAIAWSPDERWTAVATESSVFVFRTNTGEARIRRLPIEARDLAWR
jgi:hypothetical protein